MKRAFILAAMVVVVGAAALAYRATTSTARFHLLDGPAFNITRVCMDGMRYTWMDEETSDRPPSTPKPGTPRLSRPLVVVVQLAVPGPPGPPVPTDESDDAWSQFPAVGGTAFTAHYRPIRSPFLGDWFEYSFQDTVPFGFSAPPNGALMRIDMQPNENDFEAPVEEVRNCLLFGRLQIRPHEPTSRYVSVALLSTGTFRAIRVSPASVLFGLTGSEAAPLSSVKKDVNRDGRKDLLFRFRWAHTGISCNQSQAVLSAVAPNSGKRFYETDSVTPTC